MTLALLTLLAAAAAPNFEAQGLDGASARGALLELTDKQVRLQTAAGPVALPLERLAALTSVDPAGPPLAPLPVRLELIDGSRLMASGYRAVGGKAHADLPGGSVELPTDWIASVRLQQPGDALAAEWDRILQMPQDADRLVARTGETLDYYQGVLGEVNEATVGFELEGKARAVKRAKVFGLIYYHAQRPALPESLARLADRGGSIWSVASLRLEGPSLRLTTPAGLSLARPLADLARLDVSQGKIVYLADLKPESAAWTPFFNVGKPLAAQMQFFAPRGNRGLTPGPLELDGQSRRGLALHSRTELVYRLPDRFQRFKALAGIDDRVRPHGHVRLVIRGDQRVLLDTAIRGSESAQTLDLDINDVRRLSILVDFGEDMDVGDHLDLAEARVVK